MRRSLGARMNPALWDQVRNILCVRLDYMGDVLMMTPAIRAIRESGRNRRVTLLASPAGAAAARMAPEIDRVLEYDAPWMKHGGKRDATADFDMIRRLREEAFDAAVIFTTYSQSPLPAAMLCQLADIPLRLAHCRENPYRLLTDWVRDPEPQDTVRHEVRRQLDLVATIGCRTANERLSCAVPQEAEKWAASRLSSLGIDNSQRWLLLHPGASAASRRYPPRQWSEAADQCATRLGCRLIFTGSSDESEMIDAIRADMSASSISLAGELDLGRLAALIAHAPVMVSSNTGPAHLAAALQTPIVDLYALTNPQHTPWQVPSRVLFDDVPCRNCYRSVCPQQHHACLAGVAPSRIVAAVQDLLEEREAEAVMPQRAREAASQPLRLITLMPPSGSI
jgi:lipopolysaccharide heptosyltransferase II